MRVWGPRGRPSITPMPNALVLTVMSALPSMRKVNAGGDVTAAPEGSTGCWRTRMHPRPAAAGRRTTVVSVAEGPPCAVAVVVTPVASGTAGFTVAWKETVTGMPETSEGRIHEIERLEGV